MIDLDGVPLLGVDVGFSSSKPTTGIAWSKGGMFEVAKTHTDWQRRSQHIPAATTFSVIAIDGPLVPPGSDDSLHRLCERIFIRGLFQARCKPGLSHIGYGRDLRRAAAETAAQVVHLADRNVLVEKTIRNGASIVEAFPNAFLGVLLPEARFAMPAASKRKKFDWLYDHAVDSGVLENLFHTIGWLNLELIDAVLAETDHEKRAAWICLLTAACAATGKSEVVGDDIGGWFWLPPTSLWTQWARDAFAHNMTELRRQRYAS
ncbi:putative nuclease with RNAse H fold [Rhizobium azooxidifex]|uniref:Putative nuclease with RNAse H fold n=2 Tax=Mycoplana azooxidifex TaxID=1636188 RepID=A0A7W6GLF1_9HYPH|nr:putative nuclease with RNAse H fold [Mycoplana azooxidifex]